MRNKILKTLIVAGLTTAVGIVIARYKKGLIKRIAETPNGDSDSRHRHVPHGRHTIVKKRAQELLHV